MGILLIAGLWLDGSAWDAVVPEVTALGHHPVPLALPGQGDGAASATLDDQRAGPGRAWGWVGGGREVGPMGGVEAVAGLQTRTVFGSLMSRQCIAMAAATIRSSRYLRSWDRGRQGIGAADTCRRP